MRCGHHRGVEARAQSVVGKVRSVNKYLREISVSGTEPVLGCFTRQDGEKGYCKGPKKFLCTKAGGVLKLLKGGYLKENV